MLHNHELLRFGIGSRGVQPLANFIWMSCDEEVFWMGIYEYASGLVHLKGHFDDDLRDGRGLFPLLSCYVCVCVHDGEYLLLETS